MNSLPTVCILAGGLGTRLGDRAQATPKVLTDVGGEPFLFHQLRLIAEHGAQDVVLCVGHLGEMVEETAGASRFGLELRYSYDGPGLDGTLGAIRRARPLLADRFLVLYGDTYLRVDYQAFSKAWIDSGLSAGMTVLHNRGQWDRSNVVYAETERRVLCYDKVANDPAMEWIDYGLGALRSALLDEFAVNETDLAALYQTLAQQSQLFGFIARERFFEIGTPAALEEATDFLTVERRSRDGIRRPTSESVDAGAEDG